MRYLQIFLFCLLSSVFCLPVNANPVKLEHTTATLVSEYDQIAPDQPFWVMLHLEINDHWHTYWKNPGDSGLAPMIDFAFEDGTQVSDIVWQPPRKIPAGSLMNYGYENDSYHLLKITPPKGGFNGDALRLDGDAAWLVCKVECIPEEARLVLDVNVGSDSVRSTSYDLFQRLKKSAQLKTIPAIFDQQGPVIYAAMDLANVPNSDQVQSAYLYPDAQAVIEPAEPQNLIKQSQRLILSLPKGTASLAGDLTGILEFMTQTGPVFYRLQATLGPIMLDEVRISFVIAVLFAFIGGIILNAMPCVFPVLSLKALSLTHETGVKMHGIFYMAGILVFFALLGGLLIALKEAGGAVGWGYQMQSPLFVAFLIYLLFLIGLNLAGLFDIPVSIGWGQQATNKGGMVGSFATGALAALVATPCTAPFMATALGAALSMPTFAAMMIFLSLGLGLAFPYLLLCFVPGALSWMPKPGAWMEHFKQFLSFPIFLTVIWLLWVIGLQIGVSQMAWLMAGLVVLTLCIWSFGVLKQGGAAKKWTISIALAMIGLYPVLGLYQGKHDAVLQTVPYDAAHVQSLVDQGKPVFVYATAAWCITCKLNENVALHTSKTSEFFTRKKIAVFKADWTNSDPQITKFLSSFSRSGVPLYVYYAPSGDIRILPQLLTQKIIIEHLSGEGEKE